MSQFRPLQLTALAIKGAEYLLYLNMCPSNDKADIDNGWESDECPASPFPNASKHGKRLL